MTIVNKNQPKKKKVLIRNDPNSNAIILDIVTIRENSNYIAKFGLFASIAQHIDFHIIFYDININNFIITSNNIKFIYNF